MVHVSKDARKRVSIGYSRGRGRRFLRQEIVKMSGVIYRNE